MHIRMSCLIIKTVNFAVITAMALAAGGLWLQDVRKKQTNSEITGPNSFKTTKDEINTNHQKF